MHLFPIRYQKYQIIQKPRNPTPNLLLKLVAHALADIYMTRHLKTAKHYLLLIYKMKFHISAASLTQMVLPSLKSFFNNCSLSQEILTIAMARFCPASFEPLTFQQHPEAGNTVA